MACGSGSTPAGGDGGSDATGADSSADTTANDALHDDGTGASDAAAPFVCPNAASGNPTCAAQQWCIVPCTPAGGGKPPPPFCVDSLAMVDLNMTCPGGTRVTDPVVECQCP